MLGEMLDIFYWYMELKYSAARGNLPSISNWMVIAYSRALRFSASWQGRKISPLFFDTLANTSRCK